MTAAGWGTMLEMLSSLPALGDRVLVVTGAGEDFCAGADQGSDQVSEVSAADRMRIVGAACLALHRLPFLRWHGWTGSRSEPA